MIYISNELANHNAVQRVFDEMPDRFLDIATEAANTAIAKVKKTGVKRLKSDWNVPKGETGEWTVRRAKAGDDSPMATASVKSPRLGLINFGAKPANPMTGKTSGGVSFMLGGQRHTLRNAFVAEMSSGHKGIFQRISGTQMPSRQGQKREQIRKKLTTTVPHLILSERKGIKDKIDEETQAVFEEAFISGCASWLVAMGAK